MAPEGANRILPPEIKLEVRQAARCKDKRPETYAPADLPGIRVVGHVGTEDNWRERRRLLLKTAKVYDRRRDLFEGAKANTVSLAVFKPKRIHEFLIKPCKREWDAAKMAARKNNAAQGSLFDGEHWQRPVELIPKLPYDFSYPFTDAAGRSKMRVLDWELGEFYDESQKQELKSLVCPRVHKKYFDEFRGTDLHFVLGTIHRYKTWVIVGVLPFPFENRMDTI